MQHITAVMDFIKHSKKMDRLISGSSNSATQEELEKRYFTDNIKYVL